MSERSVNGWLNSNLRAYWLHFAIPAILALTVPALAQSSFDWTTELINAERQQLITLTYRGVASDYIAFSYKFVFLCSKKETFQVSFFPDEKTYNNNERRVPIALKAFNGNALIDMVEQRWTNGFKYIAHNDPDDVRAILSFLKANQNKGTDTFLVFSRDFSGRTDAPEQLIMAKITLNGFSREYDKFERDCQTLRSKR